MISIKERNRIARAINRYVRAQDADSWKGAGHPDDVPATEAELKAAKARLTKVLDDVTERPANGGGTH